MRSQCIVVNRIARLAVLSLLWPFACSSSLLPAFGEWTTQIYGSHALVATSPNSLVQESSGVVASRLTPDVYWTHNDSGSAGPRAYAFRLNAADKAAGTAKYLGYVELTGASNSDWEDIAAGPNSKIYAFDGGDNPPCGRTDKRIHRFAEPAIDPNGSAVALTTTYESFRFEYPDSANAALPADTDAERYDAECLFVHPVSGDVYIVTKRDNNNSGTARLYKLAGSSIVWNSATIHVLQFVADLTATLQVSAGTVTGGDVDADGRRVLIRRYPAAYEFVLPSGLPFDSIFLQTPTIISLAGEIQGEGVCYATGGGDIITTSEVISGLGPQTCPFFVTPWQLANVRAEPVRMNHATVRWDTAAPLASTVNYGTTASYGSTSANATAVNAHAVSLTSLASATRYYFKVTSGSLAYPSAGGALSVFFDTRSHVGADFDADGDVDMDDFAHLQACFSGPQIPQGLAACLDARLDADDDVDHADYVAFQACASGSAEPVDPNCEP